MDKEIIKEAILTQHQQDIPLMEIGDIKGELLAWLDQIKIPTVLGIPAWADLVEEFPADPGDKDTEKGIKVRLAIKLKTPTNNYLITIMECLELDARGIYILSAYVNWNRNEKQVQKALEEMYAGHFDDSLRTRHTVWVQNFKNKKLGDALTNAAIAILGHELSSPPPTPQQLTQPVKHMVPLKTAFPSKEQ